MLEFGLMIAVAGKPCLMEKPKAMNYLGCARMNDAFRSGLSRSSSRTTDGHCRAF
jgi:hypothetical protein